MPLYYIGQVQNITTRKKMEDRLRKSELVTRTILDNIMVGVIQFDQKGIVGAFNPAASHIFDYLENEIVGEHFTHLMHKDFRSRYIDSFQRHIETCDRRLIGREKEIIGSRKDGSTFPARFAINKMVMNGVTAFVGVVSDIAEEKKLQMELIRSEKMASLGNMVAGIAHEINTPMGIGVTAASELREKSAAFTRLMEHEGISEQELYEFLSSTQMWSTMIHDNLIRAGDLMRSFKSVAVDQASEEMRTFSVSECINATLLTMHHDLKRTRITINVNCLKELNIISLPGVLSQIIINLINNSMIHAFKSDDNGLINIDSKQENNWLVLSYRDSGRGMTEEQSLRVFEPFFTTRRESGGSGLGMHIVYNLVTLTLGGTITCDSKLGNGVEFLIRFPFQAETEMGHQTDLNFDNYKHESGPHTHIN